MSSLLIDRRGVELDYGNDCLIVRHESVGARSVPMRGLERVVCMHNVVLGTRVIGQFQRFGIDFIALNSRSSERSFAVHAAHAKQAGRRVIQYQTQQATPARMELARRLVALKLLASIRAVGRNQPVMVDSLRRLMVLARAAQNMDSLRGFEGIAQRNVFAHWRGLLPPRLGFEQRRRRPPPDPVNAVLSLSYGLAYHEAIRQCMRSGLDPWLGVYHALAPGRHSLACDLIEPLRPRIEKWVVELFCSGCLDRRHFSTRDGQCLLGKAGRSVYYHEWHAVLPQWTRRLRHYARRLSAHLDSLAACEHTRSEPDDA